jgi:hypothetical protein
MGIQVQLIRLRIVLVCVAAVCAAGVLVRASGPARTTAVQGSAWNQDNSPLRGARVQLRDLETGRVSPTAIADDAGRFSFADVSGGTYAVELVGENGKVVTAGHPFVIAPGETVATFVRLGAKTPWFSGFFKNAAGAVASSAASQGITALAPVQLPVSAGSGR